MDASINPIRLNIGAGSTVINGWTPIDKKIGLDARKLNYADNSIAEIRASHILEHFSFADARLAMLEWVRVLQPGGRIRIGVPDVSKINRSDEGWRFHLMGGQTDEDDFHRSAYDDRLLRDYMLAAGLTDIQTWEPDDTDMSRHYVSLCLEGTKPAPVAASCNVKICALMSIPRVGWNDNWGCTMEALRPFGIPVHRFTGVFWGQCMQRAFVQAFKDGVDWVLTIDYDSVFMPEHLDRLLGTFGNYPNIHALAATQSRRQSKFPLATHGTDTEVEVDGSPIQVTTAHFGLTLLRVACLEKVEKPWFWAQPSDGGEWEDGRLDDDIWFWHQWRKAGWTIYIEPHVRIGHLEMMVSDFDDQLNHRLSTMPEWRKLYGVNDSLSGIEAQTNVCENAEAVATPAAAASA